MKMRYCVDNKFAKSWEQKRFRSDSWKLLLFSSLGYLWQIGKTESYSWGLSALDVDYIDIRLIL